MLKGVGCTPSGFLVVGVGQHTHSVGRRMRLLAGSSRGLAAVIIQRNINRHRTITSSINRHRTTITTTILPAWVSQHLGLRRPRHSSSWTTGCYCCPPRPLLGSLSPLQQQQQQQQRRQTYATHNDDVDGDTLASLRQSRRKKSAAPRTRVTPQTMATWFVKNNAHVVTKDPQQPQRHKHQNRRRRTEPNHDADTETNRGDQNTNDSNSNNNITNTNNNISVITPKQRKMRQWMQDYTQSELKALCDSRGLSPSGTSLDVCMRLYDDAYGSIKAKIQQRKEVEEEEEQQQQTGNESPAETTSEAAAELWNTNAEDQSYSDTEVNDSEEDELPVLEHSQTRTPVHGDKNNKNKTISRVVGGQQDEPNETSRRTHSSHQNRPMQDSFSPQHHHRQLTEYDDDDDDREIRRTQRANAKRLRKRRQCPICHTFFATPKCLTMHISRQPHCRYHMSCPDCFKTFTTPPALALHIQNKVEVCPAHKPKSLSSLFRQRLT